MSFNYGVLSGGRQGTAAAFDMESRGDAAGVVIADLDQEAANRAESQSELRRGPTASSGQ